MSAELSIKSVFKLHTGNSMPKLGFGAHNVAYSLPLESLNWYSAGVYKSERHVCENSIATAIECGYR